MAMKRGGLLWCCITDYAKLLILLVAGMYPASVLAAEAAMSAFDIPLLQYGYVILMGSWGALASILQRFTKHEPDTKPEFWKVALSDYVNAVLGAVIVFLACEAIGIRPALEAIYCSLAGFGGSRFMTALYLRFETRAANAITRGLGDDSNEAKP